MRYFFLYILRFFKDWLLRIAIEYLLLREAINKLIEALKILRKKFKSILKFKRNFRMLKNLLLVFWQTFLIFCSLINEILFLNNLINWVAKWIQVVRLLTDQSVLATRILYFLYLILLGILGIIIGFLSDSRER